MMSKEKEEFDKWERSKWRNRRFIMFSTLIAYILMIAYVLVTVDFSILGEFSVIINPVTTVLVAIITLYFGGSSFERSQVSYSDRIEEFERFHSSGENIDESDESVG